MKKTLNLLIVKLILQFANLLSKKSNNIQIPQDAREIEIKKWMNYLTVVKKLARSTFSTAVYRNRSKVMECEVNESKNFNTYLAPTSQDREEVCGTDFIYRPLHCL